MILTSVDVNPEKWGNEIPQHQLECIELLRKQAFELQRRFSLLERTAIILDQMLEMESTAADLFVNTYEGHAYISLRYQLFRLLIVDIFACVLDQDTRSVSVYTIYKRLNEDPSILESIKAYYLNPSCMEVKIDGCSPDLFDQVKKETIDRKVNENTAAMDKQWDRINKNLVLVQNDGAKRIDWARKKAVAHFDATQDGMVALHDVPPFGNGPLTWDEPIRYLNSIQQFVYDLVGLVTWTSWSDPSREIDKFYAKTFWDRFKNGHTSLNPPRI